MTDPFQEWCDQVNQKESNGELTFKEAPINTYLQLTTEPNLSTCLVGRIVLKPHRFLQIDGEDITWFADTLTWIRVKNIEDCIVVRVRPNFDAADTIDDLQAQVQLLSLETDLEEDLSARIAEMHKYIAMNQGSTMNGIARLLSDCQKRMAADWVEVGRHRINTLRS